MLVCFENTIMLKPSLLDVGDVALFSISHEQTQYTRVWYIRSLYDFMASKGSPFFSEFYAIITVLKNIMTTCVKFYGKVDIASDPEALPDDSCSIASTVSSPVGTLSGYAIHCTRGRVFIVSKCFILHKVLEVR